MKIGKILGILLLLSGLGLVFKTVFLDAPQQTANASLRVDSFPRAKVFLNNNEAGTTPYLGEKLKAGGYQLKLIPDGGLLVWEAEVKLNNGTLTYVGRDLGKSEDDSGGQILTLEKAASGKQTELTVISSPDGANVTVDDLARGKAPLILSDLSVGEHVITISADGFADQLTRARLVAGFRLNATVKLKKNPVINFDQRVRPAAQLIASPSAQTMTKPYVVIKDTPLGFLRVRSGPDYLASEAGRVLPGERFPLLDQSTPWLKIKWQAATGWIFEDYAEVRR